MSENTDSTKKAEQPKIKPVRQTYVAQGFGSETVDRAALKVKEALQAGVKNLVSDDSREIGRAAAHTAAKGFSDSFTGVAIGLKALKDGIKKKSPRSAQILDKLGESAGETAKAIGRGVVTAGTEAGTIARELKDSGSLGNVKEIIGKSASATARALSDGAKIAGAGVGKGLKKASRSAGEHLSVIKDKAAAKIEKSLELHREEEGYEPGETMFQHVSEKAGVKFKAFSGQIAEKGKELSGQISSKLNAETAGKIMSIGGKISEKTSTGLKKLAGQISEKGGEGIKNLAGQISEKGGEGIKNLAGQLSEKSKELAGSARATLQKAGEKARSLTENAGSNTADLRGNSGEKFRKMTGSLSDKAKSLTEKAREKAEHFYDSSKPEGAGGGITEKLMGLKDKVAGTASGLASQAKDKISSIKSAPVKAAPEAAHAPAPAPKSAPATQPKAEPSPIAKPAEPEKSAPAHTDDEDSQYIAQDSLDAESILKALRENIRNDS